MANSEFERKFVISKDALDTINSIAWFLADASWMSEFTNLALALMVPTIFTGLCLLYIEKRLNVLMINLSINCWILMNFLWILSDANPSGNHLMVGRGFFLLGSSFIVLAVLLSKSNYRETFSHFRRFRRMKL